MSDEALSQVVEPVDVFARVSPRQKNRVILALKHRKHVVGYMGDGINDAPSLHTADVGISVSTGVDVAKDAAAIILLEKSLAVLHNGVLEGRKAFGTQTLIVFIIRTIGNPLHRRPSTPLIVTVLCIVAIGIILPYTPLGVPLGFTPLPRLFFLFLIAMTVTYMVLVDVVKRPLMRRYAE